MMEQIQNIEQTSNEDGICYIVGAGTCCRLDFTVSPNDYVIAADGGLQYLQQYGIKADLVIGDLDSMKQIPDGTEFIRLNQIKDETDTYAAMQKGVERGYQTFCLYGCTGGRRFDHTLANIQLLTYLAENNRRGYLVDESNILTVIKDGSISLEPCREGYVSVFSISEQSLGVNIAGLKYQLKDAVITNAFPIGVSNECIGSESRISVCKGTLLVVYPR